MPARKKKKHTPTTRPRRSTRRRSPLLSRRVPTWLLWVAGIVISVGYVWAFYHFFVGNFSLRWRAMYGEVPDPDGYEVRGIDISHYQSLINWDKLNYSTLHDNRLRFIIIKATEGSSIFDTNFNQNFFQAKDNGFIRGAYHYFKPQVSARAQAEFFLSQVHLEPGDLPPILDVEETGGLTTAQLQSRVRTWFEIVGARYGVRPILYTGYNFKITHFSSPEFDQYPFWIAHYYVQKHAYEGEWAFWQYTDCGAIDGINGRVDCDIFNGTVDDLKELCIQDVNYPINLLHKH